MLNYSTSSPDVIQAYLAYLQEMSRKIILRSGMENVLYRKPKQSPSFYRSAHEVEQGYLREVNAHLDKVKDRQLFFGNGLIAGVLQKDRNKKNVAAPLISSLVNLERNENGRSFTWDIALESVSLNYDLVTLVLQQDQEETEIATVTPESAERGINLQSLDLLEQIEQFLELCIQDPERSKQLAQGEIAAKIFADIRSNIREFQAIRTSQEEFIPENLGSIMQNSGLIFYRHCFLFVAALPGQLSTYTALHQLLVEVS